jgi:hypothetical protein
MVYEQVEIANDTRALRVTAIMRDETSLRIVMSTDDDRTVNLYISGGKTLREQLSAIKVALHTEINAQPSRYVSITRKDATEIMKRLDVARANVDDAGLCVEQIEKVRTILAFAGAL